MKNVTFVLIICLVITLAGCKQIIYRKYGMHDPREETTETLRAFLAEKSYPRHHNYIFADSVSYLNYLWDSLAHKQIISTTIYSQKGLLSKIWDPNKCQWSGGYYISHLKNDTVYEVDSTHKIQALVKHLIPLFDFQEDIFDPDSWDFIALVTWGKFLGQYNERQFIVEEVARQNTKAKVVVFFLNIDMQKEWNLSESNRLKIK
ncbi:MAG: hypothetical protein FJY10_02560 [Bacteroidetes bacterium]|nr:hypothetical protein [Bacteroidota bacterium]